LADLKPSGKYLMEDLRSGWCSWVMKYLLKKVPAWKLLDHNRL
jgi:hypothetical protein